MTYSLILPQSVSVSAKDYVNHNIKQILDCLENLDFMKERDKIDVLDKFFGEVLEYVESVKSSIQSAKDTYAEYEDKDNRKPEKEYCKYGD